MLLDFAGRFMDSDDTLSMFDLLCVYDVLRSLVGT